MTFLRMLWEFLTGRTNARIARLEVDLRSLGDKYNSHVVFVRSKLAAVGAQGLQNRAMVLRVASALDATPVPEPHVVVEAFGDKDDEATVHLSDFDIISEVKRNR